MMTKKCEGPEKGWEMDFHQLWALSIKLEIYQSNWGFINQTWSLSIRITVLSIKLVPL